MPSLYLISQTKVEGYDTYDSAVVCASTLETAKLIHPSGKDTLLDATACRYTWPAIEYISAKYLGESKPGLSVGVVCASFNAG